MATIKYLLQSKKDNVPIYIRYSLGRGLTLKRKTGFFIDAKKWSKTGYPIAKDEKHKKIKSELQKLKLHIEEKYNEDNAKGVLINGIWLENTINHYFNRFDDVNDMNNILNVIQYLIDTASIRENDKGGTGISEGRIKAYQNAKNTLEEYLNGQTLLVKNIDIQFSDDYKFWMRNEKKYSESTVVKRIKDLKLFCKTAERLDVEVNSKYRLIKPGTSKKEEVLFLNRSELSKIKNTKIENKKLNNAKKWLLFGCEIGLRVNDLLRVTAENIKKSNEGNFRVLEIIQRKKNKKIVIPLSTEAEEVIKEGLPYKISSVNLNKYIKEVCMLSGISNTIELSKRVNGRKVKGKYPKYELITSHVCRKSFASNYYGKMPIETLMTLTDHSTEKQLLEYIGKTDVHSSKNAYKAMLKANK